MRVFKSIIKYLGIGILVLILFRGFLYRSLVNYSRSSVRSNIVLTDNDLIREIDMEIGGRLLSIDEVICFSNRLTSEKLEFTFDKVSSNPNLITISKKANCIGYSSLVNSIGNYIIREQNQVEKYEFIHRVGKLDVLGINVHNLVDRSFFRDHDFNEIRNKQSGERTFIDPSLRDYFRIDKITCE